MYNYLYELDEQSLLDLLESFLPKNKNEVFSSENIGDEYNYNVYEDLSEYIIKEAIMKNKVIINKEVFTCYFSYDRYFYELKITYGIGNYNFCYKNIEKSEIHTKQILNLNKIVKKIINIRNANLERLNYFLAVSSQK